MRMSMRLFLGAGLVAVLSMPCRASGLQDLLDAALDGHARGIGLEVPARAHSDLDSSNLQTRQLPLYREALDAPLKMAGLVDRLEKDLRQASVSPDLLMRRAMGLSMGQPLPPPAVKSEADGRLRCAADPLVPAMRLLRAASAEGESPAFEAPAGTRQSWELRLEIGRVLVAIAQANQARLAALRDWPRTVGPHDLLQQVMPAPQSDGPSNTSLSYRSLLRLQDRGTLHEGMSELASAFKNLDLYLTSGVELPAVQWRWDTPMGVVIVDTTGADSTRSLRDPLLVVDVGGNDTYHFLERGQANRISLLLDAGGNDRYMALAPGVDASVAVLGYGILWDTAGDDVYEGGWMAQGAALFGMSLHFDGAGNDTYRAQGLAQAFAIGGSAVLLDRSGDDQYVALTHSQAAAGPEGMALLMDVSGNDLYQLGNQPIVWPSPQLPDRNVSMGQGAGRGERQTVQGLPATAGGVGVLMDMQGNDRYLAQVFAQGVGYQQGFGLLVDSDGRDVYESAWYGMAAAAHGAVGVLIDRGGGNDVYRASHSTSLAAAHDGSATLLIDDGGDDEYTLGNLGLGAVNDGGFALFLDASGKDSYRVLGTPCLAFGIEHGDRAADGVQSALGLFLGRRTETGGCAQPPRAAFPLPRRCQNPARHYESPQTAKHGPYNQ